MFSAGSRLRTVAWVATFAACALGCEDKGKVSEKAATAQVGQLVARVDGDVAELERGLPAGATRGFDVFYKNGEPRDDLAKVKKGLERVQRQVPDLTIAKSTFFALLDDKGVAIRNNLETDVMGGRDLFALFPALRGQGAPMQSAVGKFPEAQVQKSDPTWIAVAPIKDGETVRGYLASGWSFRRFAYHLQEDLRSSEKAQMVDKSDAKLPIYYVAVFDAEGVYTAPQTPQVNEDALQQLGLAGRTSGGNASGTLDLEGRPFGWAAARTPKWGEGLGVVLLRSEI